MNKYLMMFFVLALTGCATLRTAAEIGRDLCKLNVQSHEGANSAEVAACDTLQAGSDWATVANQVAAKPDVAAAKEALAASPPLQQSVMGPQPCTCPSVPASAIASPPSTE